MIQPPDGGRSLDPGTLAAVMAAVQAYLGEEARAARPHGAARLGPWKTAPWRMVRGGGAQSNRSWRHGE